MVKDQTCLQTSGSEYDSYKRGWVDSSAPARPVLPRRGRCVTTGAPDTPCSDCVRPDQPTPGTPCTHPELRHSRERIYGFPLYDSVLVSIFLGFSVNLCLFFYAWVSASPKTGLPVSNFSVCNSP